MALLAKWVWRLGEEGQELWKQIIKSKYNSRGNLKMNPMDKNSSRWWRDVCKSCGAGQQDNWF